MQMIGIVLMVIWLSVSIAICVGIYFTHDINCLWFFIIPALIRVKTKDEGDEDEE